MKSYTVEEITIMLGEKAYFPNGTAYELDGLDVINAKNDCLSYLKSIPYLDQIRTKKLFKLLLAK